MSTLLKPIIDLGTNHPLVGLLISSLLTVLALKPYLRRQPELLPLVGVFGVVLQRWQWWFRGTPLFSLEVPLFIALALSLSRVVILFFAPQLNFRQGSFYKRQPGKKEVALILILICLGVIFQVYEHDILDPAIDALLASLLVTNLSLFSLSSRKEALLWAYAYNVIGILLTGAGVISPLEASLFYVGGFIPSFILRLTP